MSRVCNYGIKLHYIHVDKQASMILSDQNNIRQQINSAVTTVHELRVGKGKMMLKFGGGDRGKKVEQICVDVSVRVQCY